MNVELDALDIKVFCSLLSHAGEAFRGKRGYSLVEYAGLTEAEDQILKDRMNVFLEAEHIPPPYEPDRDWCLLFLRFESLLEAASKDNANVAQG